MSAPDPLAPTPLFAFPLYSSVLAGFDEHQAPLLAEVLAHRDADPGVVRSNRNAWHSGDAFLAQRSAHLAWVIQKVTRFAHLALATRYANWSRSELQFASCWANVLGPGGWNAPHHHFPCHWSGVFYVDVGDAGAIPGDPSGMIEFLNPTPWMAHVGSTGNHVYAPKPGLMLLFPSSLQHFVHPHAGERPRVSIAYNFNVVPKGP